MLLNKKQAKSNSLKSFFSGFILCLLLLSLDGKLRRFKIKLMSKELTQEKLEELLGEQTKVILNAVDHKFARLEVRLNREYEEVTQSIKALTAGLDEVRKSIQELTAALNQFIRRVEAQESKVEALYSRVEKITSFLKEKFGVEITA